MKTWSARLARPAFLVIVAVLALLAGLVELALLLLAAETAFALLAAFVALALLAEFLAALLALVLAGSGQLVLLALAEFLRALIAFFALLLVELPESRLFALLAGLLTLILVELAHEETLHDCRRRRHHAAARPGKITQISNLRFRRPGAQINPASGLGGLETLAALDAGAKLPPGRRGKEMRIALIATAALALLAATPACGQPADLAQRLERLARAGNPEAAYHLGMLYNNGIGVPRDPQRAFAQFRIAAEGGDPLGAYKLGCYYSGQFGGEAVAPDEAQALRWKLVAARAGYSLAQLDVASIHARHERWLEALPWFEAAARQGEPQALYNLSVIYRDGLGTAPSPPRLWAMFRLSQLASRGVLNENATRALDEVWRSLTPAQREEARQIAGSFVTGPAELTLRAANGLARAESLAATAS
jgi:hypothetical protein